MTDIFLSYNREDQAIARRFAEGFSGHGFEVWWDTALKSGEAYDEVTERALRTAKAVVVLWSKRSVDSRWVRAEATLADRNRTLVPAMVEPCERPIMFELTQTAELSHWQGAPDDKAWLGFVADVRRFVERAPGAAPAPATTLRQIAAEPTPKQETTLAVLPFDNVSNDADMVFFSDGVSEDILTRLSRGSSLKLIGKTSSFQFRGPDKPKAAAALKATHVLDGSIRRAANKVRIAAHLTEAASQTMLWSDKYDRGLDDIFELQDEISEAIAEALKTSFAPKASASMSPELYDLYLRTTHDFAYDGQELLRRIALLETVVAGAPDFLDAWVKLAGLRMNAAFLLPYADRATMVAAAQAACARVLALDAKNADATLTLSGLDDAFGDFLRFEQCEAFAAAAPTALSLGALALHVQEVGRARDAAEYGRRGYELDSLNPLAGSQRGLNLFWTGRYAEARVALERSASLWPDNHHAIATYILLCAHQQDWAGVDALIAPERLAQYPLREHRALVPFVGALRDPSPEPRRMLFEMTKAGILRAGHWEASIFAYMGALGFADECFNIIDQIKLGPAGARSDALGPNAYRTHLLFQAAYPELRNDPRFVKLCARLGLVEYWLTTQKWPDCADEAPYDFRAECEKYRDHPKDKFFG